MKLPIPFWPHKDCACQKVPFLGARYQRRRMNVLTGEYGDMEFFTVTAVDPIRHDRISCRMIELTSDNGWVGKLQPHWLLEDGAYQAIDNVVPLPQFQSMALPRG